MLRIHCFTIAQLFFPFSNLTSAVGDWRFFSFFLMHPFKVQGILAHVDLMRFEDGIAIISLESSCIMHFTSVDAEEDMKKDNPAKIPVLLTPGSLILMWGEARYLWKHQINRKPGYQIWQGKEIQQKRRTSLTLRRLCQTEQNATLPDHRPTNTNTPLRFNSKKEFC